MKCNHKFEKNLYMNFTCHLLSKTPILTYFFLFQLNTDNPLDKRDKVCSCAAFIKRKTSKERLAGCTYIYIYICVARTSST